MQYVIPFDVYCEICYRTLDNKRVTKPLTAGCRDVIDELLGGADAVRGDLHQRRVVPPPRDHVRELDDVEPVPLVQAGENVQHGDLELPDFGAYHGAAGVQNKQDFSLHPGYALRGKVVHKVSIDHLEQWEIFIHNLSILLKIIQKKIYELKYRENEFNTTNASHHCWKS